MYFNCDVLELGGVKSHISNQKRVHISFLKNGVQTYGLYLHKQTAVQKVYVLNHQVEL